MGFFKTMLRQNTTCIGTVSGTGFAGCYIGLAKKNGNPALMFYGTALKEDYIFDREDIEKADIIGTGVQKNAKAQMVPVTKYQIKFKDGKTAICAVDQNSPLCSNFEARIF